MPIYRILAFFQKYDILGRFHTDVLLDDLFAGFVSDCANFAEIQSDTLLQEDISGYKSTPTFGGATESIELNHSVKSLVYSVVLGDFHSPVLLAHKAEGLSADARFGQYDNGVNLSSDFSGFQSAVKTGGSQSSVLLPSNADGFNSTPTLGAVSESIIGGLSVQDFESSAVFGASNETVELQSSIKATVISPPPPANTILAGTYIPNDNVLPYEDLSIDISLTFLFDEALYYASEMDVYENAPYWGISARVNGDAIIIGGSDGGTSWLMMTDDNAFTVTADTAVTQSQYEIFTRYFKRT